ncbi:MAG: NrdH-redoxin [Azonexus sp.]|nr:NrdH-redoxin [Azonexus sp.]
MRQARRLLFLLLFLFALPSRAEIAWTAPGADGQPQVQLYLFWSLSCPHCLEARPQIQALAASQAWIALHDQEISENPAHLERYAAMAGELGEEARYVPALFYCGRMETGWEDDQGERLLQELTACRDQEAAPATRMAAPLRLPVLGEIDPARFSLPVLTVLIAGLDAFNPCAFFVLLFLLSLLVHQQNRRRMALIGLVFVGISGLMYFAFMAAWLGLFLVVGSLPWVTGGAGLVALLIGAINVKDFIAFKKGVSLSISDTGRAGIFERSRAILKAGSLPAMLAATVFLAVAANLYELICTAGFPMVYTRLLTLHVTNPAERYAYLAFYNLIYVLPLFAIVLAFVRSMGARKLSEREGRLLKLLSGTMMFGLGLCLLVAPERLNELPVTLGLIGFSLAVTGLAARMTRPGRAE